MKHVSAKILLFMMSSALLLSGCEDPGVDVSSLGKKFAAPQVNGVNPFDQDFDSQNYVEIKGACDTRVGDISVSFDNSTFQTPPTSPNTSGTSLANVVNDVNCSDGKFDFYLTKSDLDTYWNIKTGTDGNDVKNIYIKGETLIGETKTLIISNPKHSLPASKIMLAKMEPAGYAGSDQCEMFNVRITDANGQDQSAATDTQVSLNKRTSGGTFGKVSAYSTYLDCYLGTNAKTDFVVPANQSNFTIIYKVPTVSTDQAFDFQLSTTSSLAVSDAISVQIRSSSSTRRWISFQDSPTGVYQNICYPISLRRMTYSGTDASADSSQQITLKSSDSNLKFYSDSSCASLSTSQYFPSAIPDLKLYMKYTRAAGDTSTTIKQLDISYNSITNYDPTTMNLRVDLTDKNQVTKISFGGPDAMPSNMCIPLMVITVNANWTALPTATDILVNMSSVDKLNATNSSYGQFYASTDCSGSPTSTLTVSSGEMLARFSYKNTSPTATTATLTLSASVLGSQSSQDMEIRPPSP